MTNHPAQFSFADGEQSRLMLGSSLSQPKGSLPSKAAESIENFVVQTEGGVSRRRGTQFLSTRPVAKMIPMMGDLVLLSSPTPIAIIVRHTSYVDDDSRVRIDGVTMVDTGWNVAWYSGQTYLGPGGNPSYATTGFREIQVTYAQAAALGVHLRVGAFVQVDTRDGWAGSWRTAPWVAEIQWSFGPSTYKSGGSVTTGPSPVIPSPIPPGYYSTGPHFTHHIPNGSFLIE